VTTGAPVVDGPRLWHSLQELAAVGATRAGGVSRVALTPEDVAGRALVGRWLRDLGGLHHRDEVGNDFWRFGPPDGQPIMIGSHLDTQPNGGAFDGALGVLAGVEVMRTLADHDLPLEVPLELVNWTDEEGARFGMSCIGSSVYAGDLSLEDAYSLTDADGVSFGEALRQAGLAPAAAYPHPAPALYVEVHIEQARVLERQGRPLGLVTGIQSVRWLNARLSGAQTHAGTTPLDERRDAMLAAARVIDLVDSVARASGPEARGAACRLHASPNTGSVIADRVDLLIDLRHPTEAVVAEMHSRLQDEAARIAAAVGVRCTIDPLWTQPALTFDRRAVEALDRALRKLGLTAPRMVSRAGHDAGYVSLVAPSAMLFVRCRAGISHAPDEHAEPDDVELAANALLQLVLDQAGPPPRS
jgi:beta-ureidopropionase / N-carbamoyl-L-amino-acid hydrolase